MASAYRITIKDLQGRTLSSYEATADFDFSMSDLKAAVYLLEISDNTGKRSVHRLLKH
jgi:hypothetical protein